MMKKNPYLWLVYLCFIHSSLTVADNNLNYNLIETRYVFDVDRDDLDVGGDGFGLGGSLRLDEVLYVIADYEDLGFSREVDTRLIQGGAGFIFPLQQVDMVAEIALLLSDVSVSGNDDTDEGLRISSGARAYLTPKIEGRALINYVNVDYSDTYLTVAADYFLTKNIAFNISVDVMADVERFAFGARFYLGD